MIRVKLLTATLFALLGTAAVAEGNLLVNVEPGLTAQQYAATATTLAAEAETAYPTAFADFPLWNQALANAEAAVHAEPNNADHVRLLAMLYTKTKWWSRAMNNFDRLQAMRDLDFEAKSTAAFVARKLGVMALDRGDGRRAAAFLQRSMMLEESPVTLALLQRVNAAFGF